MRPTRPQVEDLLAHGDYLARLARRLVSDESAAEDLVQQTWLTALRKPPRHSASLRGWLGTVMRSAAFDWRSTEARRGAREHRALDRRPRSVVTPYEELARDQVSDAISEAIAALPDLYAEAVRLRFDENLPPRELGKRLGIPAETARTRVKRGVALLRQDLDSRCGDRRAWVGSLAAFVLPSGGARSTAALPVLLGVLAAVGATVWLVAGPSEETTPALVPGAVDVDVVVAEPDAEIEARARVAIPVASAATTPIEADTQTAPADVFDLRGTVIDGEGRVVPQASLLLIEPDGEVPRVVGRADASGGFALEDLPRAGWLGAKKGRRVSRMAWLDGPGAERVMIITLRLGTTLLEGMVYGSDGAPRGGARVAVIPDRPWPTWGVRGRLWRAPVPMGVWADADGRFQLEGRGFAGRWLEASAGDDVWWGPTNQAERIVLATRDGRRSPGKLRKEPGVSMVVDGRVVDEDGAPLAGAWLVLRTDGDLPRSEPLSPSGDFELHMSGAGSLAVWRSGEAPHTVARWPRFIGRLNLGLLRMEPVGGLVVRVLAGGRNIDGWSIGLDAGGDRVRTAHSSLPADGIEFEETVAYVHDLAPGTWPLVVKAPGFVRGHCEVEVVPGRTIEVEVTLVPGTPIEVDLALPAAAHVGDRVELTVYGAGGEMVANEWLPLPDKAALRRWKVMLPPGEHQLVGVTTSGASGRIDLRPSSALGAPLLQVRPR